MDLYPGSAPTSLIFFDYHGTLVRNNALVRGMDAVIRDAAKVHKLIIISHSTKRDIETVLKREGLVACFTEIKTATRSGPKGDIIKEISEEYDIPLNRCVFVTDTHDDLREAKRAGIQSIFVPWGIESRMPDDREAIAARSPTELSTLLIHFCS